MAKKETTKARTTIENVNDQLSTLEQKLENNKKIVYYALGAVVALILVGGIFVMLRNSAKEDVQKMMSKADIQMMMQNPDSALILYKRAVDQASIFAGNEASRAAHMAAATLYEKGKYDEAIKYLEGSSFDGKLEGPAAKSLLGDCYVNKKEYDKAISCYKDAIDMAGDNEAYAPIFMKKKATVEHATKKYADEAATYEQMKEKFPQFAASYNIDKNIERAKALAGK